LGFLVAGMTAFLSVSATSFDSYIAENFFQKTLISFAFCHTQLAY
jgi:hypothetical protein